MFKKRINKKIKSFGKTDYEKKLIEINPRKGDMLNTVIHEELHAQFPNKPEKWIAKKTALKEKKLTPAKAMKKLARYKRK